QVGTHDAVDAWALDLDRDGASVMQACTMYLAERGTARRLAFDLGADLANGRTPLAFEHALDVSKTLGWHLVLQGCQFGQCLLRQEICTRAEELAQFDQQATESDRGEPKITQHAEQGFKVRTHAVVAALTRMHDSAALTIDHIEGAQQQ